MRQSAFSWSPDKIDAYIADPERVVPGDKMRYHGLADAQDRADIVAYLKTLH
jgi:cytochrome c2